jgi:hypothetical protein
MRSAEVVKHRDNFTFTYHLPACKNRAQHNASDGAIYYGNEHVAEEGEVGLVIQWMG